MDENRFIDLETKIAFHEHTINELNKIIYQQQKQIDQLEKNSQHFAKRLNSLSEVANHNFSEDEKPPHY